MILSLTLVEKIALSIFGEVIFLFIQQKQGHPED
jgi:hypothetical protein